MNKGLIYKIATDKDGITKYYLKLERNLKIGDKEYNIYIIDGENKPVAELFQSDKPFAFSGDLTAFFGKKYEFSLDLKKGEIISIEYEG